MDISIVIMIIWSLAMLWLVWAIVANNITYSQRMKIHRAVFSLDYTSPEYKKFLKEYKSIDYNTHARYTLYFKSLKGLYSKELLDLINKK